MGSLSLSDTGGETEESCNKRDLPNDVVFLQPPHLSLAGRCHFRLSDWIELAELVEDLRR